MLTVSSVVGVSPLPEVSMEMQRRKSTGRAVSDRLAWGRRGRPGDEIATRWINQSTASWAIS